MAPAPFSVFGSPCSVGGPQSAAGIEPRAESSPVTKPTDADGLILEAWAQGYLVGSLIIMAAITVANMRRGVLLHKLILLELILGTFHGTFIFTNPPVYGWYLSTTAIFLNMSWSLHNVIAWMKNKPFLSKKWSMFYIGTVILAQPYWVVEIYANFAYFNNINKLFEKTRPYEAIFRDPWWIFTTLNLFYNITTHYRIPIFTIVTISPRFGVLLLAMCLSIAFIIVDICSVSISSFVHGLPDGLNPFWKLAFVFKCLTDSIILDDFKTALDRLMRYKLERERIGTDANGSFIAALDDDNGTQLTNGTSIETAERMKKEDPLSDNAIDAAEEAEKVGRVRRRPKNNEGQAVVGAGGGLVGIQAALAGGPEMRKTAAASNAPMARNVDHYDDIDLPAMPNVGGDPTISRRDMG